jgi:glycogen debranching enzyme
MPETPVAIEYGVVARASRPGHLPLVLKDEETFAVFDPLGDIRPGDGGDLGVFHEGSRHASRFELSVWGRRPLLLSSTVRDDHGMLVADLTNPDIPEAGVAKGAVAVRRTTVLGPASLHQQLVIVNYSDRSLALPLAIRFDADFHDIFEERGMRRPRRGDTCRQEDRGGVRLAYRGLDGRQRFATVWLDGPLAGPGEPLAGEIALAPRCSARVCCCIDFAGAAARASPAERFDAALESTMSRFRSARRSATVVDTSNEQFNQWAHRSFADVHLLATRATTGLYPHAGVPWFAAPFGRDGIITARQLLTVEPRLARGVLGFLARHQAASVDPSSDAQPGKILHESRLGEMAALREIPFGLYYGSVDSTPLFLMLAGDYLARTEDRGFLEELWPHLEAAALWLRRWGDHDHDGFVEYHRATETGLRNQAWKDSDDSVFHRDGRLAEGAIAMVEVQAYAYAAWRAAERIATALGRRERAEGFRREAIRLRRRFNARFWRPELGTYALALDGEKRPCVVRSSNAGHCLWTGIAQAEQARSVARALLAPSSFNGFGIRTLDEHEARYNPMSYHNGSIWPHDNAMIALGLARYGLKTEALRIMAGLFDASCFMPLHRLPELFCGFTRREGEGPTLYPVACSPQAWASGAVFALLEAVMGLSLGFDRHSGRPTVRFHHPVLPPSLAHVRLVGLRIGDEEVDLELHRHETDVGVQTIRRSSMVDIVITA